MAHNFMEGCEPVRFLEEETGITPDRLDHVISQANITADSDPEEVLALQEAMPDVDSLTFAETAEAADACQTCIADKTACPTGMFFSKL